LEYYLGKQLYYSDIFRICFSGDGKYQWHSNDKYEVMEEISPISTSGTFQITNRNTSFFDETNPLGGQGLMQCIKATILAGEARYEFQSQPNLIFLGKEFSIVPNRINTFLPIFPSALFASKHWKVRWLKSNHYFGIDSYIPFYERGSRLYVCHILVLLPRFPDSFSYDISTSILAFPRGKMNLLFGTYLSGSILLSPRYPNCNFIELNCINYRLHPTLGKRVFRKSN